MMTRRKWLWTALLAVPLATALATGGLVYASSQAGLYVCPLAGDVIPCQKCCPLNQNNPQAQAQAYFCPVTGQELHCAECCPRNQSK